MFSANVNKKNTDTTALHSIQGGGKRWYCQSGSTLLSSNMQALGWWNPALLLRACFWEFVNTNWKWNAQWNKLNEMNTFSQNKKVSLVKSKVTKNKIKVAFLYQTQDLWPPVDIFFSINLSNSNHIFIPMQSLCHLLGTLKEFLFLPLFLTQDLSFYTVFHNIAPTTLN